jgi:hypothetical protein
MQVERPACDPPYLSHTWTLCGMWIWLFNTPIFLMWMGSLSHFFSMMCPSWSCPFRFSRLQHFVPVLKLPLKLPTCSAFCARLEAAPLDSHFFSMLCPSWSCPFRFSLLQHFCSCLEAAPLDSYFFCMLCPSWSCPFRFSLLLHHVPVLKLPL